MPFLINQLQFHRTCRQIPLTRVFPVLIGAILVLSACHKEGDGFAVLRADRTISGTSKYPLAIEPDRVGKYPAETGSGAGYFYDDVLEYRVWLHPENGAVDASGGDDYFVAFAQYERAEAFSKSSSGAEEPLVLVRQRQWINEPEPGTYRHETGERTTEWRVKWLAGSKRTATSIPDFLAHPRPAKEE